VAHDWISLVALSLGLSFWEAVEWLAQRSQVDVSASPDPAALRAWYTQANQVWAAEMAPKDSSPLLSDDIAEARAQFQNQSDAKHYLVQRGYSPDIWSVFEVGWTPDHPDYLALPVHDAEGRFIGWQHRNFRGGEPRYLTGFPKAQALYNLHRVRPLAKDWVVVVEGVFGVWKLTQLGIPNAVALFGSQMSAYQAQLLLRYVPGDIFLCLDADNAGHHGATQAASRLAKWANVWLITLHDDMDTWVRPDQFWTRYAEATRIVPSRA